VAFAPGGDLVVADSTKGVLRFKANVGSAVGTGPFVPVGAGGVNGPTAVAFSR